MKRIIKLHGSLANIRTDKSLPVAQALHEPLLVIMLHPRLDDRVSQPRETVPDVLTREAQFRHAVEREDLRRQKAVRVALRDRALVGLSGQGGRPVALAMTRLALVQRLGSPLRSKTTPSLDSREQAYCEGRRWRRIGSGRPRRRDVRHVVRGRAHLCDHICQSRNSRGVCEWTFAVGEEGRW